MKNIVLTLALTSGLIAGCAPKSKHHGSNTPLNQGKPLSADQMAEWRILSTAFRDIGTVTYFLLDPTHEVIPAEAVRAQNTLAKVQSADCETQIQDENVRIFGANCPFEVRSVETYTSAEDNYSISATFSHPDWQTLYGAKSISEVSRYTSSGTHSGTDSTGHSEQTAELENSTVKMVMDSTSTFDTNTHASKRHGVVTAESTSGWNAKLQFDINFSGVQGVQPTYSNCLQNGIAVDCQVIEEIGKQLTEY